MIRWKFVLPRLAVLAALIIAITFGTGPLLKVTLQGLGSRSLGAKVSIDDLRSDWWNASVQLNGLQCADPKHPMRNLLQADSLTLDFDAAHLLRKRFVVEKAEISGLAFNTTRDSDGSLPNQPAPDTENTNAQPQWMKSLNDDVKNRFQDWLGTLKQQGIAEVENRLATVQVARELQNKWPTEYEQLRQRIATLEQKVDQYRDIAKDARENPLRMVSTAADLTRDAANTIQQIDQLYQDIQRLSREAPDDYQRLLAAKRQDEQMLKELIRTPSVDAQAITESLFGEEPVARIQQVWSWVQFVQDVIPNPNTDFEAQRTGGVDVQFHESTQYPLLWIREASISGQLVLGHDRTPHNFAGSLSHLASHPQRLNEPTRLVIRSNGPEDWSLFAVLDRTGSEAVDHIRLNLPQQTLQGRDLGNDQTIALHIPDAQSDMDVELKLERGTVAGTIRMHQDNTGIEVQQVSKQLGGDYVRDLLADSLASIDQFDVVVHIAGERKSPQLKLESTLGRQIATQFNTVATQVVQDQQARLTAELDRKVETQWQEIQQSLADLEELQQTVRDVDSQIEQVRSTVARLQGALRFR